MTIDETRMIQARLGRPCIDDAAYTAATQDEDAVCELEKHIEVFADIYDGDALHLLLGQQPIDGI